MRLVNNWIVGNGSSTALTGGVHLFSASTQSYFEFNTVAFNSTATSHPTDSITCQTPVGTTLFRNNIVVGSPSRQHFYTTANCQHANTLTSPDNGIAGPGNMVVADPQSFGFLDPASYDLHLSPTSVAIGKGDLTGTHLEALTDIDGQPRSGSSVDVGADEIP
jgi:hypothetical protein